MHELPDPQQRLQCLIASEGRGQRIGLARLARVDGGQDLLQLPDHG
ncbi:hypothetical protein [Micromonospora sp. RV43]|nr:hypothetical protein [Micromonospora sp. RV43]